jgi:hypothetical protein
MVSARSSESRVLITTKNSPGTGLIGPDPLRLEGEVQMIICGRIGSRIMARLAVLVIFTSACPLSWIRRGRLSFCVALFGLLVVPGLAVASTRSGSVCAVQLG